MTPAAQGSARRIEGAMSAANGIGGAAGGRVASRGRDKAGGEGGGRLGAFPCCGTPGSRGGSSERERGGRSRNRDRLATKERSGAGPAGSLG